MRRSVESSLAAACLLIAVGLAAPTSLASSNIAFCVPAVGGNLLFNAGMEMGEGSPAITNWVLAGSGVRADTNAHGFTGAAMHGGAYAVKGWGSDLDCSQTNIPVSGGRTYRAGGWFYHSSTEDAIVASPLSTRMLMRIQWFGANGDLLGQHTSQTHNGTSPADAWDCISLDAMAPDGATSATFHVETDSDTGGGSVFGDDFHFGAWEHPLLGWHGTVLADCESLENWSIECDNGSSGTLSFARGVSGQALQLDWDIGTGNYVQARYSFPSPVDLSDADFFGLSLRGSTGDNSNTVAFMFADTNDVFVGYGAHPGLHLVDRWMANLPCPRKQFDYFWGPSAAIDWTCINRFFVAVKRPPGDGGSGRLLVDHLQWDRAADWPRQTNYVAVTNHAAAASNAVSYILSQQKTTGLVSSWKEESSPLAWLYDQALALIVLSREGAWYSLRPTNVAAQAADKLAGFLMDHQKPDGRWGRVWNPVTGAELGEDDWVGDQSWCILAMSIYAQKTGNGDAMASAQAAAAWLAPQIDGDGKVHGSTEGNIDAWWALTATLRTNDAARIAAFLLGTNYVWDPDLRYWWGGDRNPHVYADAATWVSAFARHPAITEPERGLAALSFVKRALRTTSDDQALCGLGAMGPLGVHNEVSAQYIAAGGEDAAALLDQLLAQQRPDGGMPGSPDDRLNDELGWVTPWTGLAPTAWFYFALTGLPYPYGFDPGCSGRIAYKGGQRGPIFVSATNTIVSHTAVMSETGAYGFVSLEMGTSYWVKAYRDGNTNDLRDAWEPEGAYDGNPVCATSVIGGVDIHFEDPDTDDDGMADYWEYRYFGHPTNGFPGLDSDVDGHDNRSEFIADTVPTNDASCFDTAACGSDPADGFVLYAGPPTTNTRVYEAYLATNLLSPVEWIPLGINRRGDDAGAAIPLTVTNRSDAACYRIGVKLP